MQVAQNEELNSNQQSTKELMEGDIWSQEKNREKKSIQIVLEAEPHHQTISMPKDSVDLIGSRPTLCEDQLLVG